MRRHPAPTFVFADLAGYTALTEERGDEAAAKLAREFRRTMCALSREHGAWQVKSMGDGVMIWAHDPSSNSICAVTESGNALLPAAGHTVCAVIRAGLPRRWQAKSKKWQASPSTRPPLSARLAYQ